MKIYVLYGNDGLAGGVVGVYRCRAAIGGLNFKICSVWLDALRGGGNFIADLSSWRSNGRACACALYAGLAVKGRTALRHLLLRQ